MNLKLQNQSLSDSSNANQLLRRQNEFISVLRYYGLFVDSPKYKTICPFHKDQNASLLIDVEKYNYHCFGCEVNGTTEDLISYFEPKLTEIEKLIKLYKIYKYNLINNKIKHEVIGTDEVVNNRKELQKSRDYYFGLPLVDWYKVEDIDELYCKKYLRDRGFKLYFLNEIGCKITLSESYPIIFPLKDNGIFKGYVCRTMDKEIEKRRKYLYNKGFLRRNTLAGNYKGDTVILTEGYLDCLKAQQFGFTSVAAILGWKIANPQIEKLKEKGIHRIICALDNDDAGNRGYEYLKTLKGFEVLRLKYPDGVKDFGDVDKKSIYKIKTQIKKFGGY